MTHPPDTTQEVRDYLRFTGWTEQPPGPAGALWVRREASGDSAAIGVPRVLRNGQLEYTGVIERLAAYERRPSTEVAEAVQNVYTDVANLRAANESLIRGSIPLRAGVSLVSSAARMVRACATTAQRPRANIGSAYSKVADELIKAARFGHTQEGSYVLPVLMPLGERPPPQQEVIHDLELDRVPWEPAERRVMRTFAEALGAVDLQVIKPAREPRAADMSALVAAGASREFVIALRDIIADTGVAVFHSRFSWAAAARPPSSPPKEVSIPAEASELLTKAAKLLRSERPDRSEIITGPIVEVRHVPGDPLGSIAIQTTRSGRPSEVRLTLDEPRLNEALDWMRAARTVVAEGHVSHRPSQGFRMDKVISVQPLDATFLS